MSINIGTSEVLNIYIGGSAATAVYIGDTQIWGAGGKDYSKEYFTLKALESGTFSWNVDNVEYSLNDGAWTTWTAVDSANTLSVSAGDKVRFRSDTNTSYQGRRIVATGTYDVEGNIMSLLYGDNFSGQTSLTVDSVFHSLFIYNTNLINAENLILPATTLTSSCYRQMFQGCTSLTTAPELPAPTLANYCYLAMFGGSTNLNYIKCLATNISGRNCLNNWVLNVAATGTFVKAANMTSWPTGTSGIPDGWVVENA